MDALTSSFEWVVLSTTVVMVLALAGFIWSDAAADRRRSAAPKAQQTALGSQGLPQALPRAARRRARGSKAAASKAA